MELLQSIILGVTQGVSEFMPISSSAHLVLIPYLFHWQYNGLVFDTALHLGTVLAIIFYFYNDWVGIIKMGFRCQKSGVKQQTTALPANFLWQIIIATIPAGIAGLILENYVEKYLHSPLLLAINLIVFGLVLWLTDKMAKSEQEIGKITFKQSLIVGVSQCLALIPGVSRSGITMVASRGLGLKREDAAKFSFLLGTPAMIGAFLLQARKLDSTDLNLVFFMGVIFSALAGFLAIKFLLAYLKKSNFSIFLWYRIILAVIVLTVFFA
jgi:undecaprenyl-diphosphatase